MSTPATSEADVRAVLQALSLAIAARNRTLAQLTRERRELDLSQARARREDGNALADQRAALERRIAACRDELCTLLRDEAKGIRDLRSRGWRPRIVVSAPPAKRATRRTTRGPEDVA